MALKTHICPPCNKSFNSEEQWKAHMGGKKHLYITEVSLKGMIHEKTEISSTNSNIVDKSIQNLRALGISIPNSVNKIIKCEKVQSHSKIDISKMNKLSESCVLMEGEQILGIYVNRFFSSQKCQQYYDLLNFIYENGGFVERGKEKTGGDMVMIGWRLDTFIDKPVM